MPLAPLHRLGRFEIVSLVGAGGMGEVYRARDTRLGREVALKVLAPGLSTDDDALRRFEQEARAVATLAHPNIITIFDVGSEGDTTYLVTEMLEGETLRDRLRHGALPVSAALDVAIQIALGLAQAHAAGIVHRDVKPQNVFITRTGVAKLLDFGISRLAEPTALSFAADARTATPIARTQQGVVVGTPGYMAPEQARGQSVDARTDIFACGCVLHEMLSGAAPFERSTPLDTLAAILSAVPPPLPPSPARPAIIERTVARCLNKNPSDRFQSMEDLLFVLEAARDEAFGGGSAKEQPAKRSPSAFWWWGAAAGLVALGAGSALLSRREVALPAVTSVEATTIVPASASPITAAISPDGQWVTYVGIANGRPDLYVQFLTGGVPVNLTGSTDLPIQNRTVVGGLDVLSDGSGIAVAGRPLPQGLFRLPGIWIIPAPSGGPARRVTDRYAALRWSPDGRRVAGVIANPLLGDAIAVAAVDGQNERILVPAGGGVHLHQVAWGHDGRHVYYARTLEPRHWLSDIYRVSVDGGPPEPVVVAEGIAMFPAPTPDGKALIYAGNHAGEGLNIWWRPFDGSPERRLTAGTGEYTEPYIARQANELVCLARRRRGELLRVAVDDLKQSAVVLGEEGSGDGDPSVSGGTDRIFISSARSGRRKIWSLDASGQSPVPLTSGDGDDVRPAVSPDGRSVVFISNRGGRRGVWIVPADGGTPRLLVHAEVIDYVSWAPDSRRVVYAAPAGTHGTALWIADVNGDAPTQVPGASGRHPTWSPVADVITAFGSTQERPLLHFTSPTGAVVRAPLQIDAVGPPTALAWSPDGTHIGLINIPGRTAAEAWVARLADGHLRRLIEHPAPGELDGVTWTRDGRALLVGRIEFETEVVLIRGLPGVS